MRRIRILRAAGRDVDRPGRRAGRMICTIDRAGGEVHAIGCEAGRGIRDARTVGREACAVIFKAEGEPERGNRTF